MKFAKKNIVISLASLMILSSCASTLEEIRGQLFSKKETPDLVNSFDIPEEVGSFEVEEVPAGNQKNELKKEQVKKVEQKKTVTKTEVPIKTNSVSKLEEKKQTVSPVKSNVLSNPLGDILPSDYPEEFKAYDKKSAKFWESFKPRYYPNEQSIISVNYLGVTAGYITMQTKTMKKMNGKDVYHFHGRLKSSDSYRFFYWLDDIIESYVSVDSFLPMKYELIQREKKQDVDDLQLFDFDKMMTYHWYKRVKEGKTKEEKIEKMIPSLATDSFSALQFVRGLPLKTGDVYEFPVITRGKFWLLKAEVLGKDSINVNGKIEEAIKIKAETHFPGVLKKNGDILFWYSASEDRKLLKFQAKVKIGSINGELIEYRKGEKAE